MTLRGAQAPQDKAAIRLMQQSVQWAGVEDSQRTLHAESIHCQDLSHRLFSKGGRPCPVALVRGPMYQAADCMGVLSEGQSLQLLSLSVLTLPLSSILLFWF